MINKRNNLFESTQSINNKSERITPEFTAITLINNVGIIPFDHLFTDKLVYDVLA